MVVEPSRRRRGLESLTTIAWIVVALLSCGGPFPKPRPMFPAVSSSSVAYGHGLAGEAPENESERSPSGSDYPALQDADHAAGSGSFFSDRAIAAEFESQEAVLLSVHDLLQTAPEVLGDLLAALDGRIAVLALVADRQDRELAVEVLAERGLEPGTVTFLQVSHDTMWIRDYGPFVRRAVDGTAAVLDAEYVPIDRVNDDRVPQELAALFGFHLIRVGLALDGGNLLSNGEGLCLSTSSAILESGVPDQITELLRVYYGCDCTVFLEPLEGEPSGHVDMFAAFTAADTVVVGSYDEAVDPVNAELLDRNAARLSEWREPRGSLTVERVPMPARDGSVWRTYTNVIFANGRLLVPVYGELDPLGRAATFATYGRLLPGWELVPIDVTRLTEFGGALHCVSMNLPTLDSRRVMIPFPEDYFPEDYFPQDEPQDAAGEYSEEYAEGYSERYSEKYDDEYGSEYTEEEYTEEYSGGYPEDETGDLEGL